MVSRERRELNNGGWEPLAGGAWRFEGKCFSDARGDSWEAFDLSIPDLPFSFVAKQENVIRTSRAGCARGLHYQLGEAAQAKLVTVVQGSAQFFWVPLGCRAERTRVYSVILPRTGASLFTPADCAHGVLALRDNTVFTLRMSEAVQLAQRGEINILSSQLSMTPACPINPELLSERDRTAPDWTARRRY